MTNKQLSHNELIELGRDWLLRHKSCTIAISEVVSYAQETPDCFAVDQEGYTYLIEAKTSLSDYRSDKSKTFRILENNGMGDFRYFICCEDIIPLTGLSPGWGLLYVNKKNKITEIVVPTFKQAAKRKELILIQSVVRRLGIATNGGTKIKVVKQKRGINGIIEVACGELSE